NWKKQFLPAWEHDLQLQNVQGESAAEDAKQGEATVKIKRQPDGNEVSFTVLSPSSHKDGLAVIISSAPNEESEGARKLEEKLRDQGVVVVLLSRDAVPDGRKQFANFFSTYNRTTFQDRVAELKVAAQYAQQKLGARKVLIIGRGNAGLAALAAAP